MKLSYLPLEIEFVFIYWMMNILKYLISLIQPQIHQPVVDFQYRLKIYMWIFSINREEDITDQGALDELNRCQTPRGKSKVKISLFRRKRYQRTDTEEILSRFDKVRPMV